MKTYHEAAIAGIIALVIAFGLGAAGQGGFGFIAIVVAFALFIGAIIHKLEDSKEQKRIQKDKLKAGWEPNDENK